MSQFDPLTYGPLFAPLLAIDRRRPLGADIPNGSAREQLDSLSPGAAFAHTKIVDSDMAACCISGMWLLHDYLDESHAISQGIDTPSGSLWHAVMHRREGDFSNAKYWFRHVGRHPVFEAIGQRAAELAAVRGAEQAIKELISGAWDPCAFVDLCQAVVADRSNERELCLDVQQTEWELLFDHCYHAAIDVDG